MEKWRCRGKNTGAKVKVTEENAAAQKPSTESQPEKKKEKKWTFAGLLKRKSKQTASSEQSNSLLSLTPNPTIYYSEQVKNVQTNPSKADKDKSSNNYNKQTTGNATKKHESTDSMNLSNASTSAVAAATIQSRNSESSDTGSKYSRRNRLKARIQAKRDRYYGDSSTDDEHSHYKSSNNSNSNCYINTSSIVNGNANITATAAISTNVNPNNSLMRIQSENSIYHHHHQHHHHHNDYHRRLIEANKKSRGARTVRYMKRFYRDDTIDDHDGNIDVRIHPIYHHLSPVLQSHSNNYNYNNNNNNNNSNSNNGNIKKKADTLPSKNNLWTTNNSNLLLKPPYYQAFCSEQNLVHAYPNNYNDNIKYQSDNLHGLNDNEVFNNEYAWPQPHEAKLTTATSNYNKSRGINCHVDNKSPLTLAPASSSVSPASASALAPQPPPRSTSVSRLHPTASARHSQHLDLDIFAETNSCSGCSHNHHDNNNHSCSQQLLPCGSNVNYNSLDRIYATPRRRHRCCNRRVVRHPISEPFLLYKNNNSNNNNNNIIRKKSHEVEDKMPEDPIVPRIKKKIVPKMKEYKSIYDQPLEKRRHSKNLEEALIELETIYNSLHLNEDEDLLDRAEQRSMEEYRDKIAITAAAKAGIGGSIKSSLDTSSSSSPSPSPSAASSYELNLWRNVNFDRHDNYSNNHNHNNSHSHNNNNISSSSNNNNNNNNNDDEPRLKDDMAYRRMHQPERSASVDPSQSSLSRVSYLAASPSLLSYRDREYQIDSNYLLGSYVNVSCNNEKPKNQRRGTPDLTRDDVVYRNITHANNTLRVIEPQPPFGIPLGPVTAAAESDYLHVEPKIKHTRSSLYIPKNEPDIVTDDLAFRNLRKDTNGKNKFANSMNNISFVPTRESMSRSILAGNGELKKKRAVRSLSADLYGIIDKSNDDHHAWYKEFTRINCSKLFPQDGALMSSSSVGDISIGNNNNNNDDDDNDNIGGKGKNWDLDINGNRPKSLYQAKIQVCVPQEEDGKVLRRQSCEREFMEMENCQTFNKKCRTLSSPYYGGGSFDVEVDEGDGDGDGEVVDTNEKVIEPSSDQELSEYKQLCRNLESLIKKTSEKVKKSVEEAKSNAMLLGSNRNSLSEFIEWEELLGEDESLKINKKVIEDEEVAKGKARGKGNEVKEKIRIDKEELEKMIKEIEDDTKSEYKEPDQLLKLNIDDETGIKVIDTEASCESYKSNKESLESVVKLVPSNDAQDNVSHDDYDNSHVDYHAYNNNNDVDCDDDKQPNAEEFHLDKHVPYLSCDSTKLNDDNNFDNDFKNLMSSDSHTNIDDGVDVAAAGDDKKKPVFKQPETADPNPSELEVHAGQKDNNEKTCRGRETTL